MKKIIRVTTVPGSLGLLRGQLRFINNHYEVLAVSSKGDTLEDCAEREGVRVESVEMTRKITPIKDLLAVYRLYKLFRREKPYIVHTHTPKAGTLGMLAARLANVKHRLHTVAGLPLIEAMGSKRLLLNTVEKITYRCATKVYPNSYGLEKIILDHKFTTQEKLKVIGNGSSNGINTDEFDPEKISEEKRNELRNSLNIKKSDFVFIFLGRVVKDKGIDELINAFQNLNDQYDNIKLVLVGEYEKSLDPVSEESEQIINNNDNILFTGWLKNVIPYYTIANVLVFPSYREGFPNVVMQAGAMGLASIVSDINGCNEIIIPEKNGIIIPVKNADAVYVAMKTLYEERDGKTKEMAASARDLIVNRYGQKYIWQELLKEYQSLENS